MPMSQESFDILVDSSAFDDHESTTSPASFDVDAFARRSQCEETGRLRTLSEGDLTSEDVQVSVLLLDAVPCLSAARSAGKGRCREDQ